MTLQGVDYSSSLPNAVDLDAPSAMYSYRWPGRQ